MEKKSSYPYILSKKDDAIKLKIKAHKSWSLLLYLVVIFISIPQLVFGIYALFVFDWLFLEYYVIVSLYIIGLIIILLFAFYMLKWKKAGKEIFILHRDKLESLVENRPFKTEKHIYYFKKLEIGYQSGEDFYSEEEAKLLDVELDIEKVEGCYPIQFFMDEGVQIVDSERELPIELIRKIKKEFLLISK